MMASKLLINQFQSYHTMPKNTTVLLQRLRSLFRNTTFVSETLHGYIVLSDDAHQNEYLTPRDARREYISGFSGSAGTAIITETKAAMWTDGRYFLQASWELDDNWTLMREGIPDTPTKEDWIGKTLPMGAKVGFDPMTMKYSLWKSLQIELEKRNQTLIPVNQNLIDLIWEGQPLPPNGLVEPLPMKYTGLACGAKVENVRTKMKEKNATVFLVTALDEIAWLLNLRGSDIPYNPVFFSYVIITLNEIHFFIDDEKFTSAAQEHFNDENLNIILHPYEKVQPFLASLVASDVGQEGKTWITSSSSYAFASMVPERQLLADPSPIAVMKALKNDAETQGLINAHIKDAAALCCYFAWLEKTVSSGNVTEISGGDYLENCRRKQADYVGPSFDVISSSGANGAIIHYKPKPETNRVINNSELYLCDSGGQFKDGTTDVTRTLHFGLPTLYERECFTRVFKGQVALRTAIFPEKVKGNVLDTLARKFLWDVGLNYLHGTGHGIGAYLNVHEGPMGISWREYPEDPGLQVGMFLSNEPGYYEDGQFGIRLENIIRIVPAQTKYMSKTKYLTFADVTLVPIQTKMLLPSLLTKEEITYLNEYHELCREKVGPLLRDQDEKEALAWLMKETEPMG